MDTKPRILIVDDEPDTRDMLEALLFREGYDLFFAESGLEALAVVGQVSPDAVLLDVMMPGMDGFEVCKRLRADPDHGQVPIILVTALDDRGARLRGIEAGADDYICKPIDRLELRTRVQTITRLNRYRRLLLERTRREEAEEEVHRRNQDLVLLNRVITVAASTFDSQEILRQACFALAEAFGMPTAIAVLFSPVSQGPTLVVRYQDCELKVAPVAAPVLGPTLLNGANTRSPVVIISSETDPPPGEVHRQILAQGIGTLVVIPIPVRGRAVGTIELQAQRPMDFADNQLTLATSIATAVGQGVENSRLYQELRLHALGLEETVAQRTLELQTERDKTQAILEALGEAVLVADTDGRMRYVNAAAASVTGYQIEELLGQEWDAWQNGPATLEFHRQARAAAQKGQRSSGETIYHRKDGALYSAAVTVAPLFQPGETRKLAGFVSVHRDITPIKEAERLKDEFISNVSHELRTPLSVLTLVSGNLDTLYDRLPVETRRQLVRDIRTQVRVLNEVIEDVLGLSQIDSQAVSMEREAINLAELTREEVEKQHPLAQRKAQGVRVSGLDALPVWGNRSQLRQVIRNLLNNAIKYTPAGGSVHCECLIVDRPTSSEEAWPDCGEPGRGGRIAALRISDTGLGVNDQDLPHIFERYYRVKTHGDVPGTGLGLAIAQELVRLHNGQITVASIPEQGTTFTVLLPLLDEVEP